MPRKKSFLFSSKAWIVGVNMGYGHQRTAYPLRKFSIGKKIINANDYRGIPGKDKRVWESSRKIYEFISRFKRIPFFGTIAFSILNKFQQIPKFYPRRDLSEPIFSLRQIFSLIKKGWGEHLISKLKKNPLPLITTFFTPAFMAEVFNYPADIFCVVCDADIARSWAPLHPEKSRIKYFAPNSWVYDRLILYGVRRKNIFLTGFPLPVENIGTKKMEVLKRDLSHRILNLDPERIYCQQYESVIKRHLGSLPKKSDHPLTVLFSIGGAGAQKEIAMEFVKSLVNEIKKGRVKAILSAGIRPKAEEYFLEDIEELGLKKYLGKNIEVLFEKKIDNYFEKFNQKLRKTDILWTKPSELSFYSGLGVPLLIAPPVGSQEDLNKKWLLRIGAGIVQEDPKYANQWFFDYLNGGRFAEAAMQGFVEVEKLGVYNISRLIEDKRL